MSFRAFLTILAMIVASLFKPGASMAADELKVGDMAPDFTLKATDGKTYHLADFRGVKPVVLAWFPKADTKGCTAECKSIQENSEALKELKIAYFTISVDTLADNMKFAEKYGFAFPVLSDPTKETAQKYGVMMAKMPLANRWTFYIDKDGKIREIDKKIANDQAGKDIGTKVKSLGLSE